MSLWGNLIMTRASKERRLYWYNYCCIRVCLAFLWLQDHVCFYLSRSGYGYNKGYMVFRLGLTEGVYFCYIQNFPFLNCSSVQTYLANWGPSRPSRTELDQQFCMYAAYPTVGSVDWWAAYSGKYLPPEMVTQ